MTLGDTANLFELQFPARKGNDGIAGSAGNVMSLWWYTWHRKVSRERLGSPCLTMCSVLSWHRGTFWTASLQPIQGWSLIVMDARLWGEVAYGRPESLRGSIALQGQKTWANSGVISAWHSRVWWAHPGTMLVLRGSCALEACYCVLFSMKTHGPGDPTKLHLFLPPNPPWPCFRSACQGKLSLYWRRIHKRLSSEYMLNNDSVQTVCVTQVRSQLSECGGFGLAKTLFFWFNGPQLWLSNVQINPL